MRRVRLVLPSDTDRFVIKCHVRREFTGIEIYFDSFDYSITTLYTEDTTVFLCEFERLSPP